MRFDENAQLDTSQVEDRRGRGGAMSSVPGGGLVVGGGGLGLVILIWKGLREGVNRQEKKARRAA